MSAQSVATICQLQSNLLYSFQNFQNTELNLLPISDLYSLLMSQPKHDVPNEEGGESDFDFKSMRSDMEKGFRQAMSYG